MKDQAEQRLYWIWAAMVQRCTNPKDAGFKNYGGRGITVCDQWRKYPAFKSDMGTRPTGGLLDRIDNNKGYSPDNCQWSTRTAQNSNRRNCIYVEVDGETVTLKEACRRKGFKYRPVHKRIVTRGWTVDEALSIPVGSGFRHANH